MGTTLPVVFVVFVFIVGPNGSGKSSLLSAIRFALGVEATSDRQLWLHHGSSSKVLVGYVTLVLDNSDGRLTGVCLRQT